MPHKKLKLSALSAGIAAAVGTMPTAMAQDLELVEEILVTGSYIRRSSYDGAQPVQVIDQLQLEQTGATQMQDVLKDLTVNSGSEIDQDLSARRGTAQINIRNLGVSSSLTLVNGKRAGIAPVSDAIGGDFLDINQFPIAMIERIEVLSDGASALYGSQAVAGVANIITRKGFEGFELSGGYSDSVVDSQDLNLAAGASFDGGRGNFNIYATLYQQDYAYRSDFDFINERLNPSPEVSRFLSGTGSPGTYRRATLNDEGNAVSLGGNRITDPDCQAAGGVLRSPSDTTCRVLFVDQTSPIPEQDRSQFFSEFDYQINDNLRYYAEAHLSDMLVTTVSGFGVYGTGSATPGGYTVTSDHPFNFFVADPADTSGTDMIYIGPDAWDNSIHTAIPLQVTARPLGREVNNTDRTKFAKIDLTYQRILNGFEFDLGDNWTVDLSHGWAKSIRAVNGNHNYRSDVFQELVKSGEWNPFGTNLATPNLVSPKDGTSVAGNTQTTQDKFDATSASTSRVIEQVTDLVATGDLFEFNGSMVQAAFGAQLRDVEIDIFRDSLAAAGEANSEQLTGSVSDSQDVWAIFGEIIIPVNDRLEFQVAARYEDYGNGVDTSDPKIAFAYRATDWLALRGSWGTSFQAPTVRQQAEQISSVFLDDPASPSGPAGSVVCESIGLNNNTTVAVSGADNLVPQNSENYNFGLVVQLENGLNASLDYFSFDYTDLISQSESPQAIVDNDCLDDGIPNDPRIIRDQAGQLRRINSEFVNVGSVETSGLDLNIGYNLEIGPGTLALNASASYVRNFDVKDSGVSFDGAGSRNFSNGFNTMPELRGHIRGNYSFGDHSITGTFRYIDDYQNDQSNNAMIDAWEVFDVQYSYLMSGVLFGGDTRLSVGLQNAFDEDPSALSRADALGNPLPAFGPSAGGIIYNGVNRPGYDAYAGHDIRGRVLYARFQHDF